MQLKGTLKQAGGTIKLRYGAADEVTLALSSGASTITLPGGTTRTLLARDDTATVTNKTISGASNTLSNIGYSSLVLTTSIVNGDVSASAAIAYSKLNLATSIVNADINASAAIAYSKLNLATSIVNADINGSAAIAYSKLNLSGGIVNADVNASAAIAYSKLALTGAILNADLAGSITYSKLSLSAGDIPYSKLTLTGSVVNADVNASAAIAYSKLVLTGGIVNADINASAAIAYSKLSLGTSIVNADISASAAIAYSKLNLGTSIVNADINASAAIAYSKLSLGTSIVNADISASAAIAYSKLSLAGSIATADLASGLLVPIGKGGTGQTTAQTAIDALLPSQGSNSGKVLSTDGSNCSWASVASSTQNQYTVDIGNSSNARTATLTSLLGRVTAKTQSATVTMTIATPCVVTWTSHGLSSLDTFYVTNSGGALPTGVSASTTYYVTVVDANTFKLSTTIANQIAGTFVASSGSQSGTHTGFAGGFAPVAGGLVDADINASAAIAGSKLVAATASVAGAVTTGTQTFAGTKTFQAAGLSVVPSSGTATLSVTSSSSSNFSVAQIGQTGSNNIVVGVDSAGGVITGSTAGDGVVRMSAGNLLFSHDNGTSIDAKMDTSGNWTLGKSSPSGLSLHTINGGWSTSSSSASASPQNQIISSGAVGCIGLQIRNTASSDITGAIFAQFTRADNTVIGKINASSNTVTAYTTSSDRRLKKNIKPLKGGLAKVMAMRPREFQWRDAGQQDEGFIAQELKEVYPKAVCGDENGDSKSNPMQVDYACLTAVLVAAVQELKSQNDELRKRLEDAGL